MSLVVVDGFLFGCAVGVGCAACFFQRIGQLEYGIATQKAATCVGSVAGGAIAGAVAAPIFYHKGVADERKHKQ